MIVTISSFFSACGGGSGGSDTTDTATATVKVTGDTWGTKSKYEWTSSSSTACSGTTIPNSDAEVYININPDIYGLSVGFEVTDTTAFESGSEQTYTTTGRLPLTAMVIDGAIFSSEDADSATPTPTTCTYKTTVKGGKLTGTITCTDWYRGIDPNHFGESLSVGMETSFSCKWGGFAQ